MINAGAICPRLSIIRDRHLEFECNYVMNLFDIFCRNSVEETLNINGWQIQIKRRARRRNLTIQIKPHEPIVVKANLSLSLNQIEKFVLSKVAWIEVTQKKFESHPRPKKYSVQELKTLKKDAKIIFPAKINSISKAMSLAPSKIKFRFMKSRWGSCTSHGSITLNTALVRVPEWVQESVIVHELAHLKYMNHSAKFWKLVEEFAPQHKAAKRWLKENPLN